MTLSWRTAALASGILSAALLIACEGNSKESTVTSDSNPAAAVGANDPFAAIDAFIAEQAIDKSDSSWKLHLTQPPQLDFDPNKAYFWVLETNVGALRMRLLPEQAPMHVSSTIYLTRLGFYDGLPFHRVISGFMAQGGDPLGRGTGGPGYKYDGEFSGSARHDKPGILSMANAGPGTDGSQFFVTFGATPHLNGRHTIFGELAEGSATLQALEERGSRNGQPTEALSIQKASIFVE